MGGTVSTGLDNNDLVNNLRGADYIHSIPVERAFRAVDRGEYILPEFRMNAYKDQAWRNNHLHLSAPCIYSEVMEGLMLTPGLSFLNLGSGTGYLSTMVGLILGSHGINHGIEFYDDVIVYAYKKLEDFKKYSGAIDEFDFCEPIFMKGNCLCLTNDRRYDRIYVGAACPEQYEIYMQNLLNVGGILVKPFNDQLLQVKRNSETLFETISLLPVSFANLIMPRESKLQSLDFIEIEPHPLQNLCRTVIRNILRTNIEIELPELKSRSHPTKRTAQIQRAREFKRAMLLPVPEDPDEHESTDCVFRTVMQRRREFLEIDNNVCWILDETSADNSSDDEQAMDTNNPEAANENAEAAREAVVQDVVAGDAAVSAGNSNGVFDICNAFPAIIPEDMSMNYQDDSSSGYSCNEDERPPNWRRIDMTVDDDNDSDSSSSGTDDNATTETPTIDLNERRIVNSPYTLHMHNKVNELPLPPILKHYLNFYRY